jgi:hypothetical protein
LRGVCLFIKIDTPMPVCEKSYFSFQLIHVICAEGFFNRKTLC